MVFTKYIQTFLEIRGVEADPVEVEKRMLFHLPCGFNEVSTTRFNNYIFVAVCELANSNKI